MKTFAIGLVFVVAGAAFIIAAVFFGTIGFLIDNGSLRVFATRRYTALWYVLGYIGHASMTLGVLSCWVVLPITYAVRAVRRKRRQ